MLYRLFYSYFVTLVTVFKDIIKLIIVRFPPARVPKCN